MNIRSSFSRLLLFLFLGAAGYGFISPPAVAQTAITGAWQLDAGDNEHVLIFADGYITHTEFNSGSKAFSSTRGGTFQVQDNKIRIKWEFDSQQKEKAGESEDFKFSLGGNGLTIEVQGRDIEFTKLDDGAAALTGNWKITGRVQDEKIVPMNSTGPRKTLKLLSGTRFQWFAINPETKEFFGTGGGSYTFANGKYTENIQFFSRDSSRVGASLTFTDKIENGQWHHSGLSSTGDKIYEIWSRASDKTEVKK